MKKRLIPQGISFQWTPENHLKAEALIKPYPAGRHTSALIPLLELAQRQNEGWLSQEAVEYVCHFLQVPLMQGYEVVTFYSMFNLKPVGKYFLQVCTTTPCQLRGAMEVLEACHTFTNVPQGEVSADGLFSVCEVECLGACIDAPVVQINDDYIENLTKTSMTVILEELKSKESASFSSSSKEMPHVKS